MKAREILFEMPYLMAGSIDWGLNDPIKNENRAIVFISKNPKTVFKNKFGTLYRRPTIDGGEFVFMPNSNSISYYMLYEKRNVPNLGNAATQVKVWQEAAPGIAYRVFFEIMMTEFDTMISDRIQSKDGKRFWIRRMFDALERDINVGLFDNDQIIKFDPETNLNEWINATDAWGKNPEHNERRFFITKL